jgi:hypothetical protein
MTRNWEEMLSDPIEGEDYKGVICGDCLTSDCHHLNEIKGERVSTAYGLITLEELDKIEREVNY